jgi:hypothetical protein
VLDILLGMIFQVLGVGSNIDSVSHFMHLLSQFLEAEWEAASNTTKDEKNAVNGTLREERRDFLLKACISLFYLLQARPYVPNFLESFAGTCGSVQGGASWILSSMVNSHSDKIRSLGVRCIVCYLERTGSSADQPLSLGTFESERTKPPDSRRIQENTLSLISNVGQGFLNSNVGKGLAALGPAVRSKLLSPSKLTSRVVYKLMWHLLKLHRYRLGQWTQASLFDMVSEPPDEPLSRSVDGIKENFIVVDCTRLGCAKLNMEWAKSSLSDVTIHPETAIRDSLGVSTVMRLLRFLPDESVVHWLEHFVHLANKRVSNAEALSCCVDWQSCLFQLTSEVVEKISATCSSGFENSDTSSPNQLRGESANLSILDVLCRKLDLALDLYAALLAHRVREGGDKVGWEI